MTEVDPLERELGKLPDACISGLDVGRELWIGAADRSGFAIHGISSVQGVSCDERAAHGVVHGDVAWCVAWRRDDVEVEDAITIVEWSERTS